MASRSAQQLTSSSSGPQTPRGFLRMPSAFLRKRLATFGPAEHGRYVQKRQPFVGVTRAIAFLLSCFSVAAFANDRNVNLDGVQLCVPAQYAPPPPPFWIKLIESELDSSYSELYFHIEPEELKKAIPNYRPDTNRIKGERRFTSKGVVVSNISAISGRSQAQDRVIELVQNGEANFEPIQTPGGLLKVPHHESGFQWSLVRSSTLPEPLSTESLLAWVAAFCGTSIDERYTCYLQRIVGPLFYSVSVPDLNMENLEEIDRYVESLLRSWMGPCEERT